MIEIIGAPFDLCGLRLGSRLGPEAVRLAGLKETLEPLVDGVLDAQNLSLDTTPDSAGGMRNFPPLISAVIEVKDAVLASLRDGNIPIMIGGEHTLSVGSVGAALEYTNGDLAVLWIDAHADVNTPGGSESGNIHGMPLSALTNEPSGAEGAVQQEWQTLCEVAGSGKLKPENIAWFGLRDVDPLERPYLRGKTITMHQVDRYGVAGSTDLIREWLLGTNAKNLWISFDVDALDPVLAPGTGTAVRGGLTYRETHLLAELLHEILQDFSHKIKLIGVDVVEVNPIYDQRNETAILAVEWLASLFGKTTLGR